MNLKYDMDYVRAPLLKATKTSEQITKSKGKRYFVAKMS